MATRAITTTVQQNPPISFAIPTRPPVDDAFVQDAILELDTIFKKYQGWKDPVSENLRKSRDDIDLELFDILDSGGDIQGRIRHTVGKGLSELNRQLWDFYNGGSLSDPLLDGDRLWERRVLEYYKSISDISPLTGRAFAPTEHDFAKALIQWRKKYVFQIQEQEVHPAPQRSDLNTRAIVVAPLEMAPVPANMPPEAVAWLQQQQTQLMRRNSLINFALVVQARESEFESLQMAQRVAAHKEELALLPERISQRIKEGRQEMRRFVGQAQQSINQQIQENKVITSKQIDALHTVIDLKDERLTNVENENKKLAQTVDAQAKDLAEKNSRIAALESRVTSALSQDSGGGGGCTLL